MFVENNIRPILLIGAMKSGTSSLYNQLIKHPEIAACITKEPEYFSNDIGTWPENLRYKRKQPYLSLFECRPGQHKFTLEASTGYSKFPLESGVPQRIKEYGLDPLFIYIVRHPIERVESQYNFMQQKGFKVDAMDAEQLINLSKYFMQLEQYRSYFSKENILILEFDELKKSPMLICKKVFEFIGISHNHLEIQSLIANKTKGKKHQTREKIYKAFKPIEKYIPTALKRGIELSFDRIFPYTQKEMTQKQFEYIHNALESDMILFKKEYNFDTSKWGF